MILTHVVQYSGGAGSWSAARRVVEWYGAENTHLLFGDTLIEDQDTYRFLIESAANVYGMSLSDVSDLANEALNLPDIWHEQKRITALVILRQHASRRIPGLIWLAKGETVWEVFKRKRFIGNTRLDPCSYYLKRMLLREYMDATYNVLTTVSHIGIDWSEEHRYADARKYWEPWNLQAPMCAPPLIHKSKMVDQQEATGIRPQRMYGLGFPHANCYGFCIKAGQGQYKLMLEKLPKHFTYHERKEQELREFLGKPVAILKRRVNGVTMPYTLKELRETVQQTGTCEDPYEFGGCHCMIGEYAGEEIAV